MTHKDVVEFGEKYGISSSPDAIPAVQRRGVEHGIARLDSNLRAMSALAVEQLLTKGGGPAVDFVEQQLEQSSETGEIAELEEPKESALDKAIYDAKALIKDLRESEAFDERTIWSLADVMSLPHTMLPNLSRDQRVRLAQTTVARLEDDLDDAKEALSGQPTARFTEYKKIIYYLNGLDAGLPTLAARSKNPQTYDKKTRELTSGQEDEQYRKDLTRMAETLRLTYLAEDDER